MSAPNHPYHLVNPSAWPILSAFSLLGVTAGAAMFMHQVAAGKPVMIAGILSLLYCMFGWWRDVVKEGRVDHAHTAAVRHGLSWGMLLFIVSEVMFFAAFFWAFFHSAINPMAPLADVWPAVEHGPWPPKGIEPLETWHLPFINTLILLLSGTTVTWAHYAMLEGNRRDLVRGLTFTVLLGVLFTSLQAYEYAHAAFGFKDGVYASTFYMATGFHGLHVLIGTLFLAVCLFRARKGHFDKGNGHLGFEFAAWYWHFVDVVWLFLFICVYWWGGTPR